jgi:hypothetical protein
MRPCPGHGARGRGRARRGPAGEALLARGPRLSSTCPARSPHPGDPTPPRGAAAPDLSTSGGERDPSRGSRRHTTPRRDRDASAPCSPQIPQRGEQHGGARVKPREGTRCDPAHAGILWPGRRSPQMNRGCCRQGQESSWEMPRWAWPRGDLAGSTRGLAPGCGARPRHPRRRGAASAEGRPLPSGRGPAAAARDLKFFKK